MDRKKPFVSEKKKSKRGVANLTADTPQPCFPNSRVYASKATASASASSLSHLCTGPCSLL